MARIAVTLLLSGCGPSVEVAELGEVCGSDRVRVLQLGDGEVMSGSPVRIGERLYFTVGEPASPGEQPDVLSLHGPGIVNPRVMSSGPCGESPRTIAQDVISPREHERWPGAVVANDVADDALVVLDPDGVQPPRVLVPLGTSTLGFSAFNDDGRFTVVADPPDGPTGRLMFQRYPVAVTDPVPEPIVLLEDVRVDGGVAANELEVLVVRSNRELVRVDLAGGATQALQQDVVAMWLSDDASWIAYTTATDPEAPAEVLPLRLLNRSTGTSSDVGEVVTGPFPGVWFDGDLFFERPPGSEYGTRIVRLPSMSTIDVPAELQIIRPISSGRYLVNEGGGVATYDPATGAVVRLLESGWTMSFGAEDSVERIDVEVDLEGSHLRDTGVWERAYFDTGERELIAHRASVASRHLPDDRAITVVDIDDGLAGDLVMIDPDTLAERRIDEHVLMSGIGVDSPLTPLGEGLIAYGVRDGERSGVWLARPE